MKEILYSTKFLNLMASKRDEKADWVYAKRPNAKNVVIIAPVIHKEDGNYTLFLITKRPPITEEYGEKYCVEFPAGLVGDENANVTTNEAFQKELLEETGYFSDKFRIVVKNLVSSGGLTSEKSTLAIADIYNLEKKMAPVDDGGVITDRVEVKLDKIKDFIEKIQNENMYMCAQTLAGVYFLTLLK